MSTLKPWADGPFELILHAELHLRDGEDFDRRIALISFDNAIEVAITTYLTLHPSLRQNKPYKNEDVEKWLRNYHTKMDFFFQEATDRGCRVSFEKELLIWCHDVRNDQYHGGRPNVPRERELKAIRSAALEIFSILFDVTDVDNLLKIRIAERTEGASLKRSSDADKLIDEEFGVVRVAGLTYYTSELLYSVDPSAYGSVVEDIQLRAMEDDGSGDEKYEP
jgi:hypothetical protein